MQRESRTWDRAPRTSCSQARAEEGGENQERQRGDCRRAGGRPQVAMRFNTGVNEGREGQGVKAEGPEGGIVDGVRSCGPRGSGMRGHSIRQVCVCMCLWVMARSGGASDCPLVHVL